MTLTEAGLMNGGPDIKVALVPELGALAPMRHEVAGRLDAHVLGSATVDNLLLVLSELCTNAIQATATAGTPVLVRVWLGDTAVVIEVENVGPPFDDPSTLAQRQADADAERGRGLVIVRALTDEMTLRFNDGRCLVRAVMPVA